MILHVHKHNQPCAGPHGGHIEASTTVTAGMVVDTKIATKDFRAMMEALDSDSDNILSDEDDNAVGNDTSHRGAVLLNYDVSDFLANSGNVDIKIRDSDGGGALAMIDSQSQSGTYDITELFTGAGSAMISAFDDPDGTINVVFHCESIGCYTASISKSYNVH